MPWALQQGPDAISKRHHQGTNVTSELVRDLWQETNRVTTSFYASCANTKLSSTLAIDSAAPMPWRLWEWHGPLNAIAQNKLWQGLSQPAPQAMLQAKAQTNTTTKAQTTRHNV